VIALTDFQELLLSMLSSNYRLAVAFNWNRIAPN
jgi:hypothetical protein